VAGPILAHRDAVGEIDGEAVAAGERDGVLRCPGGDGGESSAGHRSGKASPRLPQRPAGFRAAWRRTLTPAFGDSGIDASRAVTAVTSSRGWSTPRTRSGSRSGPWGGAIPRSIGRASRWTSGRSIVALPIGRSGAERNRARAERNRGAHAREQLTRSPTASRCWRMGAIRATPWRRTAPPFVTDASW